MRIVLCILSCAILACGCSSGRSGGGHGASPELVDGGVLFRFYDPEAKKVCVVGDFNNWSVNADPMIDKNGDGEWTLLYTLEPGDYQYKFVVDGVKWLPDPRNPDAVSDGFDGRNSVVRVPAPNPQ